MAIVKFLERLKMFREEWFPIPVTENFVKGKHHPRVWKSTIADSSIVPHPLSWLKKKT